MYNHHNSYKTEFGKVSQGKFPGPKFPETFRKLSGKFPEIFITS